MSEMIERCIKAADDTGLDFEHWWPDAKERLVRAIFGAMATGPTTEMYAALSASNTRWKDNCSTDVYRALVNGALQEEATNEPENLRPGKIEVVPSRFEVIDRSIRLLEIALDAAKTGETRLRDAALDGALFLIHPKGTTP